MKFPFEWMQFFSGKFNCWSMSSIILSLAYQANFWHAHTHTIRFFFFQNHETPNASQGIL